MSVTQLNRGNSLGDGHCQSEGSPAPNPENHTLRVQYTLRARNAFERYKSQSRLDDLQTSIDAFRSATDHLATDDDPDGAVILAHFSVALRERFTLTRNPSDLDESIDIMTRSAALMADDHPEKPRCLSLLGASHLSRSHRPGYPADLDTAITTLSKSVELTPQGELDNSSRLTNLGTALHIRYQRVGNLRDLHEAIEVRTRAVELTPHSDSSQLSRSENLGNSLQARFDHTGSLTDLEKAITIKTHMVELTPDEHPDMPSRLSSLSIALISRFECAGAVEDLNCAVKYQTRAVELAPEKPFLLNNLGNTLHERFERFGDLDDLHKAITFQTRASALIPDDHGHKSAILTNLGISLHERFLRLGNRDDIKQAIVLKTRAVELSPEGHPSRPVWLNGLSNSLHVKFSDVDGNLEDLENAIALRTRAVELTSDDHSNKPSWLDNLGASLHMRFERLGNREDLERAIEYQTRAVELTPDDHLDKPARHHNLGMSLQSRFERLENSDDVEEAIAHHRHAVKLTPDGHSSKPLRINSLRSSLQARFERLGSIEDLEEAIKLQTRVVDLTPDSHPDRPHWLTNLGNAFKMRFQRLGNLEDVERAIALQTHASEILPNGHPHRVAVLRNCGRAFRARLDSSHALPNDLVSALKAFSDAMQQKTGLPYTKMQAGIEYLNLVSTHTSPSSTLTPPITLLQAHQHVLVLMPQIVWLGNSVNRRYEELTKFGVLANWAAADAIDAGDYVQALEWLESGRTIVWSQLLQLRNPLDDLRDLHPRLASDLHRAAQALWCSASLAYSTCRPKDSSDSHQEGSLEAQAKSSYSLALEYEKLLAQIREFENFEGFLQPKKFSELEKASASSHVVVINVHSSRCDALMIRHSGGLVHVPLPDFSLSRAKDLHGKMWSILARAQLRGRYRESEQEENDQRGLKPPQWKRQGHNPMCEILEDLWTWVAKPIIEVICGFPMTGASSELPHVTWCPTGPLAFLPLHAAGVYSKDSPGNAMDLAASSYTPTLETLLRTHSYTPNSIQYPKILAVSQPDVAGYTPIPGSRTEVRSFQNFFPRGADILEGSQGTINAVLGSMAKYDWVHLACHGKQDSGDPTNSAFVLHDGRLTLSTLMSQFLPRADLAVLSACQTATGDETLPEEAVHLTAGMLSVGYKSVVGTMWSIYDGSAPIVMNKFYEVMAEQTNVGKLQPAYALHKAIVALRGQYGDDDFVRWVPYVHFGL